MTIRPRLSMELWTSILGGDPLACFKCFLRWWYRKSLDMKC